jgi:hypothetical protein
MLSNNKTKRTHGARKKEKEQNRRERKQQPPREKQNGKCPHQQHEVRLYGGQHFCCFISLNV